MKYCLYCGGAIPRDSNHANNKKFCQPEHRVLYNAERDRKRQNEWQNKKRGRFAEGKKQCLLCNKWYIQVGTHVIQQHYLTAREYKEYFDLPLKRGIIPVWYKEKKAEIARENGTASILPKVGLQTRYKKGDRRAKEVKGWKGRMGNKGYQGE